MRGGPERAAPAARRTRYAGFIVLLVVAATTCGPPDVGVPPADPEYDLRVGLVQEQRGHHLDAQERLKRFLDRHPGHAKSDSAQFVLGRSKLASKLYPEAAVEFQILVQEYPRSPLRDEAAFLECVSYAEQVRSPALDPTQALHARTCLNDFLVRYPGAADSAAAVARLAAIADHLAEKQLRLGVLFVRMKRPDAARVYLEGLLQDYPGTRWEPDAWLYLGRAQEQMRAPLDAAAAYRNIVERFPDSEVASEARARLAGLAVSQPAAHDTTGGSGPETP